MADTELMVDVWTAVVVMAGVVMDVEAASVGAVTDVEAVMVGAAIEVEAVMVGAAIEVEAVSVWQSIWAVSIVAGLKLTASRSTQRTLKASNSSAKIRCRREPGMRASRNDI